MKPRNNLFFLFGIIFAALLLLGSAGYLVFRHGILPARHAAQTRQLQAVFSQTVSAPESEESPETEPALSPLEQLRQINPDICGWLRFEQLPIDLPIVQAADNDFYLTHDASGNPSPYGAVFLDAASSWQSKNIVLHGHNMKDGSMFAPLLRLTEESVYRQNQTFTTTDATGTTSWEIVSVFRIQPDTDDFPFLQADFRTPAAFLSFTEEIQRRSLLPIPVTLDEADTLLTLSTCSYERKNNRTVVVARKITSRQLDET